MMDDRGVSDLVAFMLIFVVMLASIGVVSAFGMSALEDVRDKEQLDSAQVALIRVSDQLNGIADHEAPARAAEMRVGGATVSIVDGPTANFTVEYTDGIPSTTHEYDLGQIGYQLGDNRVLITAGGVLRGDDVSGIFVSEPPFQCFSDQARVNVVTVRPEDRAVASTSGNIQVQSRHQWSRLVAPTNRSTLYDVERVSLNLTNTTYPDAWDRHMSEAGWAGSDGDYECTGLTDGAILRTTRIDIRLIT